MYKILRNIQIFYIHTHIYIYSNVNFLNPRILNSLHLYDGYRFYIDSILYRVFIYSWNILFDSRFLIKVNAKLAVQKKMSVEANL